MLWSSEFIKPEFEQSIFAKHEMLNVSEEQINSGNEFGHFEGFWTKIQDFHTTSTCIIFLNFAHHVDILLQSDFEKSHMFYDEKDADIVFHFCVANFHDNIVVVDTDEFEVFSTISIISFTFRLLFFLMISFKTRKSDFAKQKLSI